MGEILLGAAVIALGVLVIRGREALVAAVRQTARDEARYGSLLNAERAERERDANLTPEADRGTRIGAVVLGLFLIALGAVALLAGIAGITGIAG